MLETSITYIELNVHKYTTLNMHDKLHVAYHYEGYYAAYLFSKNDE